MKSLLFILSVPFVLLAEVCYFTPPEQWEMADTATLSHYIQIAYIGKSNQPLRPTLNLAIEEIENFSLKEYLKTIKEIHEQEMNMGWKDLGEFHFRSGKGRLTEITSKTPVGEVKMLQGIFIKHGKAYILTGSTLKEEFPEQRTLLLSAMRSLTVADDLYSFLDNDKKELILHIFKEFKSLHNDEEKKASYKRFETTLSQEFSKLGSHWRFLVHKEALATLYQPPTGQKTPSP